MPAPATEILTRPDVDGTVDRYPHVVGRIAEVTGLSREAARRLFEETIRFVDLVHEADAPLVPSRAIDDAWHAFILFTRDYQKFCTDRYGAFIHHDPSTEPGPSEAGRDAYLRTRALAKDRFGGLDPAAWPDASAVADCEGEGQCQAEGNCKADCEGEGQCQAEGNCKADCGGSCGGSE